MQCLGLPICMLIFFTLSMDSTTSSQIFSSKLDAPIHIGKTFIDSSILNKQTNVPSQFVWPNGDLVGATQELNEPLVDLEGFFRGDEEATHKAAAMIRAACLNHGVFQVTNHGVDLNLIDLAHKHMDNIFKLPIEQKLEAWMAGGSMVGYSGAHADRYKSKLPWNETFTFGYQENFSDPVVVNFFRSYFGKDFEETGIIYQKYGDAMMKLSLDIMELLAISLGVDRNHYRNFFEDGSSIMRCNFYPPCQDPGLALGTGPHCDPTSITILYQDQVGGLEVFTNNAWHTVRPRQGAIVINIGDTFVALCNGIYKSCLHRVVVNQFQERRSLVFFVCPRGDKVVRPPGELVINDEGSLCPEFTWSELLHFTQKCYRTDQTTLQSFTKWLLHSKPENLQDHK